MSNILEKKFELVLDEFNKLDDPCPTHLFQKLWFKRNVSMNEAMEMYQFILGYTSQGSKKSHVRTVEAHHNYFDNRNEQFYKCYALMRMNNCDAKYVKFVFRYLFRYYVPNNLGRSISIDCIGEVAIVCTDCNNDTYFEEIKNNTTEYKNFIKGIELLKIADMQNNHKDINNCRDVLSLIVLEY